MAIEQLRVGHDNFSYIIHCPEQKKAALVDPGYDASQALSFLSSHHLVLDYVIVTHYHSDHSADCVNVLKKMTTSRLVASEQDGKKLSKHPDITVTDGSKLLVGVIPLQFLLTPGHTPGGICIIVDNTALLTGDTLFIGDCGRTDLPGGSLAQMYHSLHNKIRTLPDELIIYPGHDYGDKPYDTLRNQKQTNKTLRVKSFQEFSNIP